MDAPTHTYNIVLIPHRKNKQKGSVQTDIYHHPTLLDSSTCWYRKVYETGGRHRSWTTSGHSVHRRSNLTLFTKNHSNVLYTWTWFVFYLRYLLRFMCAIVYLTACIDPTYKSTRFSTSHFSITPPDVSETFRLDGISFHFCTSSVIYVDELLPKGFSQQNYIQSGILNIFGATSHGFLILTGIRSWYFVRIIFETDRITIAFPEYHRSSTNPCLDEKCTTPIHLKSQLCTKCHKCSVLFYYDSSVQIANKKHSKSTSLRTRY